MYKLNTVWDMSYAQDGSGNGLVSCGLCDWRWVIFLGTPYQAMDEWRATAGAVIDKHLLEVHGRVRGKVSRFRTMFGSYSVNTIEHGEL